MTLLIKITQALETVSRRGDLAIAALLMIAVMMMIVPLPTPVVDVLIATNMAISVLLLLVTFYLSELLDLSSLPSLVLMATVFRLAITISTARLILLQADAGRLIDAFGNFVIGGNVAVGLVVFIIITIVQFIVITKGAERVAEVAARFSLDALPGRQMAIDADLRNGDIELDEARRLRRRLTQESHLYGSMDGAMKFVRGDAIASLIVIFVNLIGGLTIGLLQHGMPLSAAVETYSLLTVGDGLVAQIPALLISVAAGTVLTRSSSAGQSDVGTEISRQLLNDPRALFLGAAILLGLALLPGFPWPAFLALAAVFAAAGYWSRRRAAAAMALAATAAAEAKDAAKPPAAVGVFGPNRIAVCASPELARHVPHDSFRALVARVRRELVADLGINAPLVDLRIVEGADPDHFLIEFEGVPALRVETPAQQLAVECEAIDLELLGIPFTPGPQAVGPHAKWVEEQYQASLAAAGINTLLPAEVLARCLLHTLRRYAAHLIGIQETRELLSQTEKAYPELIKQTENIPPLKVADILRRLVDENVPIGNMRLILEAVVEWEPREQDTPLLVEYVRVALRRQICFRCADRNRMIVAYMLDRAAEETVRSSVRITAAGTFLSIADSAARPIIEQVKAAFAAAAPDVRPVILTSMDVRRHVRGLLVRNDVDVMVMSYQELTPEFGVQPLTALVSRQEGGKTPIAAAPAAV